jgi:hypothetical protein
MSNQLRCWDYGKVYDNLHFTAATNTTHQAGPYRGFALSADAFGGLEIAAGSGVLPDGFIWSEDGVTTLGFTPQAGAADWTVVAVHVNQQLLGGASVTYESRVGYFATAADGTVLGWIRYPGGSVALSTQHCQSAPSQLASTYVTLLTEQAEQERLPPYDNHNGCYTQLPIGLDCTITLAFDAGLFVVHQDITRLPAGPMPPELTYQHVQVFSAARPARIRLYCDVPGSPATSLTVGVYDVVQAPVAVTSGVIAGTVGWEERVVTVDLLAGTFTPGLPWTVRLTHSLDLGISIRVARIVVEFWPYP